jgi:hypothetical protein
MTEAEEKWAQPDTIVWATTGAVSQQKTMPKPGGGLTQGHVDLMQFAITSIRDCTGINLELLGQKDINQPGILEAQRKQAGMTCSLHCSIRYGVLGSSWGGSAST